VFGTLSTSLFGQFVRAMGSAIRFELVCWNGFAVFFVCQQFVLLLFSRDTTTLQQLSNNTPLCHVVDMGVMYGCTYNLHCTYSLHCTHSTVKDVITLIRFNIVTACASLLNHTVHDAVMRNSIAQVVECTNSPALNQYHHNLHFLLKHSTGFSPAPLSHSLVNTGRLTLSL